MQKLIRTALFSVFALVLTAGMVVSPAQAQETVSVDGRQGETIQDGLSTLNAEVSNNSTTDAGILEVVADDYTADGAIRVEDDDDDGNSITTAAISDLTIRILEDNQNNVQELTIESLALYGRNGDGSGTTTDVTVEAPGAGYMRIVEGQVANDNPNAGGVTDEDEIVLRDGTLTINTDLRVEDGSNVFRTATLDGGSPRAQIDPSGQAPNYLGDINVEYNDNPVSASGNTVQAGLELGTATDPNLGGTLTVNVPGGTANKIDFGTSGSDLTVNNLTVGSLTHTAGDIEVAGNFTVEGGGVNNNGAVTVDGTFDITGTTTGSISLQTDGDVDVNSGGNLATTGDIEVKNNADILTVEGTIQVGGTNVEADGDINSDGAGNAVMNVGDLTFTSTVNRSATTSELITVDGGDVFLDNVTATLEAQGAGNPNNNFIADANNAGTVDIASGLTLNVSNDDDANANTITEDLNASLASTYNVAGITNDSETDGDGDTDETLIDLTDSNNGTDASFTVDGSLSTVTVASSGTNLTYEGGTITGNLDNNTDGGTVDITTSATTIEGDLLNQAGGDVTLDAATTIEGATNNANSSSTLTVNTASTLEGGLNNSSDGTVTLNADLTYDRASSGAAINNSGSNSTIDVVGSTLKIDDSGDGDQTGQTVINNNGGSQGVTGSGTVQFLGDSGDSFEVTTLDGETNELPDLDADVAVTILDDLSNGGGGAVSAINVGEVDANDAAVTFDGGDDNSTGNVTVSGNLLADSGVTIDANNNSSDVTVTGDVSGTGDVNLNPSASGYNKATFQGNLSTTGGTVDLTGGTAGTPDVEVQGNVTVDGTSNSTELDVEGVRVDVAGDFTRSGGSDGLISSNGGSALRFDTNRDADFDPGNTSLKFDGDITVDKEERTLTLTGIVAVGGDVTINSPSVAGAPDNTLRLEDNLIIDGGTFTQNSLLEQPGTGNFLIFRNGGAIEGQEPGGDALNISNLRVNDAIGGSSNDVIVKDDIEVKNQLELLNGGVDINSGDGTTPPNDGGQQTGNDAALNIAANAEIERSLSGTNTDITLTNDGGGTGTASNFNEAPNEYNLTYSAVSAATRDVGTEFSANVNNVTVEKNATPQLIENETVNGKLDVKAGGAISDDDADGSGNDNNARTLTLSAGQQSHSIVGQIEGVNSGGGSGDDSNPDEITLDVTGNGVTINGSTSDDDAATIDGLTASGTGLTVSNIQQVQGDVTVADGGGVTEFTLSTADGDGVNDGDSDVGDDGTIEGTLEINDLFTLGSDIEVTSATGTNDVFLDDSGTNAELALSTFDLVLTGASADFDGDDNGDGDATIGSQGGRLVFNGGGPQTFGTGGVTVPRVAIQSATDLNKNVTTDVMLDVDAPLGLDDDTYDASGTVDLAANVTASGSAGNLLVTGSTITVRGGDRTIESLTSDPGQGNTVTVESDDPTTARQLTVGDNGGGNDTHFNLDSGTFEIGQNDLLVNDDNPAFDYNGGTFSAGTGFVILEPNAKDETFDLSSALELKNVRVTADADLGDDQEDLTITDELELDAEFDVATGANDGNIVMGSSALVQRLPGTAVGGGAGNGNPLAEALGATDTYDVTYGDGTDATTDNAGDRDFNSGFELDPSNVNTLTINTGRVLDAMGNLNEEGAVYLESANAVFTADVDVEALILENGNLDYGRQVNMVGSRVERTPGGELADEPNGNTADGDTNDPSALTADNTFVLEYRGSGGDITASTLEFTSDVSDLETRMDGNNVTVDFARTINTLTVANQTDGAETEIDGVTLTVNNNVDVTGGDLVGSNNGDLTIGGDLSITGTLVSAGLDISGNTTVDNSGTLDANGGEIATEGDITVNSGTFAGRNTDLRFDGNSDQALSVPGDISVNTLTIDQATPSNSSVPVVDVSGGDVSTPDNTNAFSGGDGDALDLNNGVLLLSSGNQVDLNEDGFDRSDVDPAGGDTSHVAGEVAQEFAGGAGAVSANFPVGAAPASPATYRPFELFFPNGITRNNTIAVKAEDSAPSSRNGFPITSEFSDNTSGTFSVSKNFKPYSWTVSTATSISLNQNYEVFARSDGLDFNSDPVLDANDYRLVRRTIAPGVDTKFGLVGTGTDYTNSPVNSTTLDVRTSAATGDLPSQGTRFVTTPPTKPPTFTNSPSDGATRSVKEGKTLSETYTAQVVDPSSNTIDDLSVDAPSSIEDSVSIDESTGELTYSPGFDDAAGSPYTLTISATDDQLATGERTLEVSVNNVKQKPEYTAPLDDGTVQEGDTFTRTIRGAIQDPNSSGQLNFSIESIVATGSQNVSIDDNVTLDTNTGDPQTAEFTYTPDLDDDAGSPYEVTARITDSDLQTTKDSTFTITVTDDAQMPDVVADDGDLTGNSALDEDGDGQANATVSFTATADDPNSDGNDLSFSINDGDVPFASFDPNQDVTVSGDDATVTIALDPGFDAAANSPYTLTATATDTRNSTSDNASIQVEVNDVGAKPTVSTSAGDQTIQEDDDGQANVTLSFTGTAEDPDSDGSDLSFQTNLDFATVSNTSVSGDDKTATIALDPALDDAGSYTLTVTATDNRSSMSGGASIGVTVNDNPQAPAFVDGEAPTDRDGFVAEEVAPSASAPAANKFTVQAEVTDPASSIGQLSASAGQSWADAGVTSTSNGVATITVTLTPPFNVVKTAAEAAANAGNPAVNGTEDVSITLTDGGAGTSFTADGNDAATIDLRYDRKIGDVDDSGTFSNADASQALAIAVGKNTRNGVDLTTDRKIRAADFISPNATVSGDNISWPNADTLDANRDHVNSFDALRIFRKANPSFFSSGATAVASAKTSADRQSPSEAVRVGEVERKDGTAVVPILLSKNASDVQATDIEVTLTDGASVKDVRANTPDGWMSSHSVTDEGVLKLGMMGTSALKSGRIATVRLNASSSEGLLKTGTYRLNGADEQNLPVETAPSKFALKANYPNPVKTSTTIEYKLKEARSVTMAVYNTLGQKVATLVDEKQEAGSYTVNWEAGNQISSGVYFYRIKAGDFTESKRITVVR